MFIVPVLVYPVYLYGKECWYFLEKMKGARGGGKESQSEKFCRCIKKVRRSVRSPRGSPESAAIGICVKSVLQRHGRTLRRFKCGPKPKVQTQKLLRGSSY
jgi:hypothetical protein